MRKDKAPVRSWCFFSIAVAGNSSTIPMLRFQSRDRNSSLIPPPSADPKVHQFCLLHISQIPPLFYTAYPATARSSVMEGQKRRQSPRPSPLLSSEAPQLDLLSWLPTALKMRPSGMQPLSSHSADSLESLYLILDSTATRLNP